MIRFLLVWAVMITIIGSCGFKGPLIMPPKQLSPNQKTNASATGIKITESVAQQR